ncbi:MAG: phosphoglycerate dehydrogenase [Oscillospiraceae bacterium]|nr:phosphoglycerate dehydrogenase [Oscillospiraceae bacterium]
MVKVLITPRSFGQYSKEPYKILKNFGIDIVENPTKLILSEDAIKELIVDVDGIIVGVDPLNKRVLEQAGKLTAISKYGVGLDNVDLDYCKEKEILVTITQNANSDAVADHAFALMLSVARRIVEIDAACRNDDWTKKVAIDVFGKKIGILGLGHIGRGVVKRAKGFDMDVFGYDVFKDEEYIKNNDIHFTSLEEIFKECDFISIHLPLVDGTRHIIDEKMLNLAKSNLVIVNTARGGIIDEDALYDALLNKKIYGAGIDVFEEEPPKNSKLLTLKNATVTSHSSASTIGAVDTMGIMAANNLIESFKLKGIL